MDIRMASIDDSSSVSALWTELLNFYDKKASEATLVRSFRYAVSHPRQVRVYVAVHDGIIAATASLHLGHYSTWNDNWYGHIEDVIVASPFRRQGVGRRLILYLVEEARQEGLSRVELNVLGKNTAAQRLYEQLGFNTDSVVYELQL